MATVTPAKTSDEKVRVPSLCAAQISLSKVHKDIFLRLDTVDGQIWVRLSRKNFLSLAEYLNKQARRMTGN